MSCACLWAKAFPLLLLLPDIAAVGTIFNDFSYGAVSARDSNLSPSRRLSDALHVEPQLRIKLKLKVKDQLLPSIIKKCLLRPPVGTFKAFLVFIRNLLISSGLEPVIIHTKKLCLASYYNQFSKNIKMYNHKIKTSVFARAFGISGLTKLVLIL